MSGQSMYEQLFNSMGDRRDFLKKAGLIGVSLALLINFGGCSAVPLNKDLVDRTKGFKPYNGINPNLESYHRQRQTWLDNVIEHKVEWAGTQYVLSSSEPIVAPADGAILHVSVNKRGYHGLEDIVIMDHGDGIQTSFIHMKPGGSAITEMFSNSNAVFKRGERIGYGSSNFKMKMYRQGIIGDMDHYGQNMGFLDYWDGEIDLDYSSWDIFEKNRKQANLIYELIKKYNGPGSEQLQDVDTTTKIPKALVHSRNNYKKIPWEHAMVIKMLKFMYDNQPGSFNGTKKENDYLIAEIYKNQPVILTLPFKKH